MSQQRGLGKGFGSLLPSDFDESLLVDKKDRTQKLFISEILADPEQPRKHFEPKSLKELSESIKRFGILQPLVVTPRGDKYIIVAGERRFRAAKLANLKSVPALIRSSEELERLEIGLVENVQRVDLSPLEQAVSVARLNEQFNLSLAEIAKRLGKAETTVVNIVRLLKLPDFAKDALMKKEISEGHARTILSLQEDEELQKKLLASIKTHGWSVRQAEKFVQESKLAGSQPNKNIKNFIDKKASEKLSAKLKSNVRISRLSKGGKIQIACKTDEDLEDLLEVLYRIKRKDS